MTKTTKNWLLALVAAIVTPVAIYWLTPPRQIPTDADKPAAPQTPVTPAEPQTYTWDGRVIDQAKLQLLSGVDVSLAVAGATFADATDSEGRFIFVVPRSTGPVVAVLKAAASGYKVFTRNVAAEPNGQLERQAEIPLVPAPPPAPDAPVDTTLPKAMLMKSAAAVPYRAKSADLARHVLIPGLNQR